MRNKLAPVALGLSTTLLLFACGQSPAPQASSGDTGTLPSGAVALSLDPGANNLYFEPILAATNGWGPIEIDHSIGEKGAGDGGPITLNGKTYARGFGTHAYSELRFALKDANNTTCTRFTADIGVDDEVGNRGSVVFQILLDGKPVYSSGVMTGASATKQIDVPITGQRELRMVVTDAGDGMDYDHADWATPLLYCRAADAPGTLDPSFDGDGQVVTDFGVERGADQVARQVIQQPDGKLLVGGTASGAVLDASIILARYLPDGRLDPSFGTGGRVLTDLSDGATLGDLQLQPDGHVVVGGALRFGLEDHPFLARYRPDGTLDGTFGEGGRVVVRGVNSPAFAALGVQADGRVVLGANTAVLRFLPGGAPDPSFGGGSLTFPQQVIDFTVGADGRVLVLGAQGLLRRYNPDGTPDATFGSGGDVTFGSLRGSVQELRGTSLLVLPSGGIVVGLTAVRSAPESDPPIALDNYLSRLGPDGQLDRGFGEGGFVNTKGGSVANLRVLQDGKILSYPVRYGPDGQRDPTFNPPALPDAAVLDTTVQRDGRIAAAGRRIDPTSKVLQFLVLRILP